MSMRYGRSLPKGPRPPAPKPKLGSVGSGETIEFRRYKKKQKSKVKSAAAKKPISQTPEGKAKQQQTGQAEKGQAQSQAKPKQKIKDNAVSRTQGSVPVEYGPRRPRSAASTPRSGRVVVIWKRQGLRYLAWGNLGVKAVEGWKECTDDFVFRRQLAHLRPIETTLVVNDLGIPVCELLDLMIMAGRVIKPRTSTRHPQHLRPKTKLGKRSKSGGVSRRRTVGDVDLAKNEVLVRRPSADKLSPTSKLTDNKKEQKRQQLLAQQRRELKRLQQKRRKTYRKREYRNDLMDHALRGGLPGLKR